MRALLTLACATAFTTATPAFAAEVFFDGFEGDAPGLSYTGSALTNWTVGAGYTVDVVSSTNPYGITVVPPAMGNVLDLDGTPGPGWIYSNSSFNFNAGDLVTLSFDVGGSQRSSGDDYFATGFYMDHTLASDVSGTGLIDLSVLNVGSGEVATAVNIPGATSPLFVSSSISFRALGSGSTSLGVYTTSADNIGPLLDNVRLDITSAVPEPATWALMILGFGAIGGMMRGSSRRRTALTA
jgi:hypothetical protein